MLIVRMARALWALGRGLVSGLPAAAEDRDPIELFQEWFRDADRAGLPLPESMTVATVTPDGRPSARTVLLKAADRQGFVFYTNYGSRKAQEISQVPFVALVFHWNLLQRQVRIEGRVEPVTREESAAYFSSRPRGSQIGAWASLQSGELASREELETRVREMEQRFAGSPVPLPEHWGGYRVTPSRIEFWQGRADRLHDRVSFDLDEGVWRARRLYP